MTFTRCLTVLCTLAALLLLSACGPSNTVHLVPLKPASNVLPTPSSSTIAVVQFADKRVDTSALGMRRDKSYFTTMDSPTEWISKAIADHIGAQGYQVSYATSAAEAIKGNPDYILTGSLEKLDIQENSATSFETTIRAKYVLSNREKKLVLETLTANQSKTSLPSSSAVESLLGDTLKDIINPMFQKVQSFIKH